MQFIPSTRIGKKHMTRDEMDTLQYEVSLNGVSEEFKHVLDSEAAKYGELEPDQMYSAVKCHEVYLSLNKHLQVKTSYTNQSKVPQQTPKATFVAATLDSPEADPESIGSDAEGGTEAEESETTSKETSGTYLPEFLSDSPIGGDWCINVKMANSIQANEQFKRHCLKFNSPDHVIKDCPQAKNG